MPARARRADEIYPSVATSATPPVGLSAPLVVAASSPSREDSDAGGHTAAVCVRAVGAAVCVRVVGAAEISRASMDHGADGGREA